MLPSSRRLALVATRENPLDESLALRHPQLRPGLARWPADGAHDRAHGRGGGDHEHRLLHRPRARERRAGGRRHDRRGPALERQRPAERRLPRRGRAAGPEDRAVHFLSDGRRRGRREPAREPLCRERGVSAARPSAALRRRRLGEQLYGDQRAARGPCLARGRAARAPGRRRRRRGHDRRARVRRRARARAPARPVARLRYVCALADDESRRPRVDRAHPAGQPRDLCAALRRRRGRRRGVSRMVRRRRAARTGASRRPAAPRNASTERSSAPSSS